ncbi:MAG: efflux RND transporter periplasmic adaptor subunit [Acetobacter sp.]|nr:efflux RND transporter periplasmic adaptor subunit [Acetobacter sp.]
MENKKERSFYIFLLLVLCLISFGLGYYIFKKDNIKEIRPVPINDSLTLNATPIIPQDIVVQTNYVGFVEAINQVQIVPYISGYLKDIKIKAGQTVHKNDLLITLEPEEYKAKLDAAEAAVLEAEASFEYNQNYYERVQKSGKRAFSEIEIDNAKNNFLQAQAQLKNTQANKMLADVNYNYTIIKAPISGLIGNFTLSPGDYVAPNSGALLNIVQTDPIRVVFSLTDTEYFNMKDNGQLFKDSVIQLRLPNGKLYNYTGEFKYTNNEINRSTNSLAIYTYFQNDKSELLPNAYVTVVVSKTFKNAVLINKNLVQLSADGNFTTISRQNNLIKHKLIILAEKENSYVVQNTFESNDLLLLEDISNLPPNTKIDFKITK